MAFGKFLDWLRGGRSPRQMIVRLKMISRRMDRQHRKLRNNETKLKKELHQAVTKSDMEAARLYAGDVVRSRKMALGCQRLSSRINTIVFKLEQAHATEEIARDLHNLVGALAMINQTLQIPQLTETLEQMEIEMGEIDMSSETIGESFEGLMEAEVDQSEIDKVLGEVLTEEEIAAAHGLPTPDAKATEIAKELEKLKKGEE
ncbi:MAG: Snf7 family protein [Candidatus Hodarchaeota archaeon]